MDSTQVALTLIVWLLSAGISAWIAERKGRSAGRWAMAGLAVGVFAVILIAFMPPEVPASKGTTLVPVASATHSGAHYAQRFEIFGATSVATAALCGVAVGNGTTARVDCPECLRLSGFTAPAAPIPQPGWSAPMPWWKDKSQPAYWAARIGAAAVVGVGVWYAATQVLGGSTMDRNAVAAQISGGVRSQFGAYASVDCPAGRPAKAGTTFVCTVSANGQLAHARVDVFNDQGDFQWVIMP